MGRQATDSLLVARHHGAVKVRFHAPPDDLRCFFTTFYVVEFNVDGPEPMHDSLHPEWTGLRLFDGPGPAAWMDNGQRIADATFQVCGPTSHSIHFAMPRTRMWGIGLLPLGWAQFFPDPASNWANVLADGRSVPAFAWLAPLADTLFGAVPHEAGELARIVAYFRRHIGQPCRDAERIKAIHAAIVDPGVSTVADLVQRTGTGQRTVERICARAFGFSAKLLLRRQRFMRSLVQFMLDPSQTWIGSIDPHYHDQAQFVRDFHEFMGCTPSDYAAVPHPILGPVLRERARITGAAVQTLDRPDGAGARAVSAI